MCVCMQWTAASDVCFLSQFLLKQVFTGDARTRQGGWVRRNKVTIDAKTRIDKGGNTTVKKTDYRQKYLC